MRTVNRRFHHQSSITSNPNDSSYGYEVKSSMATIIPCLFFAFSQASDFKKGHGNGLCKFQRVGFVEINSIITIIIGKIGFVVKEIFGGALQSQVKCLSCGAESNTADEIMDISLEILHSISIKESMQKKFQSEILDGNNKYKCETCDKLVTARKQMSSILQMPNILVIQLKVSEYIFGRSNGFLSFQIHSPRH
ncbi:hypothetical protein ARALYDRAFT_913229 [Arabidopsis lyrata subsp. lyrata]|uniref:ubiquitinyl hydrolase 1 n=1 Tax=Arabidopsis lyrata subsp. lyrata TaxID=81972 RepID=D7MAQ5_ARALL|nr:hypothetical protein ARALYDRAFT_913229 [Arabidopsis lyrata subsp. lyrata]